MVNKFHVIRRPEHRITAAVKGWPDRPTWLVYRRIGAPIWGEYVVAGFPTHAEAIHYANLSARGWSYRSGPGWIALMGVKR